jgi:hypothetical protein
VEDLSSKHQNIANIAKKEKKKEKEKNSDTEEKHQAWPRRLSPTSSNTPAKAFVDRTDWKGA